MGGTLSTVMALCGYDVNCICYSSYLSERDQKDFEGVFEKFGVKDNIVYSNINDMCRTLINEQGDIKGMVNSYIRGELAASTGNQKQRRKRVLLIDEVDVFFGIDFFGDTFNPATRIQNEHTFNLMRFIWKNPDTTVAEVTKTPYYEELVKQFGQWESLLKGEISKMLLDVKNWQKENPMPIKDKIAYAINGNTSFTTAFGYCTPFAYFHYHDKGEISIESLKEHVGVHVVYGIFSFAEIPKQFDVVMGVSGTLAELTTAEKEILSTYNIKQVNLSASMYGDSRLKFAPASDVSVFKPYSEWMLKVTQSAKDQLNADRSVIVIFKTTQILEDYMKRYQSQFSADSFQVLTETSDFKTNIIRRASNSGMLTLVARSFGRGSDFACNDERTRAAGGVHVIQTFISESAAEEIQIMGRSARQGDPGSYEMILEEEELINEGLTEAQINNARATKTMHNLLRDTRDKKHEEVVRGLIEGEQMAAKEHARTMGLHAMLSSYDPANNDQIQKLITDFNGCGQTINAFHFYFVLDDSGSMAHSWKDLIAAVKAFIQRRKDMCAKAGCSPDDRITIINYSSDAKLMCSNEVMEVTTADKTQFRNGGTNFKAGLKMAHTQMSSNGDNHKPVLVFMSDGGCNNGNHEIQIIARDYSPDIFIFGFSKHCARDKLKTMAIISGGEYYEGTDAAELKAVFEEVSTKVSSVSF